MLATPALRICGQKSGPYPLPIRYILVLHTGQLPVVAGLPFFMVVGVAFRISLLVLHFRQYASIRCRLPFYLL